MIERVLLPGNVLDRIAELERRIADLEAGAVTVQVVEVPSGGNSAALNGWLATGSAFQDIAGRIVLDASLPGIKIDSGGVIYSADCDAGVAGFKIDGGIAEFNNVTVRGALRASTFLYGQILATGGTVIIAKASGKLYADCTTASSFTVDIADPDGMSHAAAGALWAVNDIIRLKDMLVGDVWAKVTAKTDMTTYWRLTVSLQSGPSGITFRAGMAVVNYGQSGQGYLLMTADDANGPFYSVRTHAGSPWSDTTELARMGNLNGNWGYSSAIYGIALGQYASNYANLTWDPANGLRIRNYDTTVFQVTNTGQAHLNSLTVSGLLSLSTTGELRAGDTTNGIRFGYLTDGYYLRGIGNGATQVEIRASDGRLVAGGGTFILDRNGPRVLAGIGSAQDKAYRVVHGDMIVAIFSGWISGSTKICEISAPSTSGYNSLVSIGALSSSVAMIELDAIGPSGNAKLSLKSDATGLWMNVNTSITGSTPIGCRVYRSTAQSIPNNTITPLSWDTEVYDIGGCWSPTYPDRLVAPVAGYYMAGGGWGRNPANNPTASRHWVWVEVYDANNTLKFRAAANELHTIPNNFAETSVVTGMIYLNAGEYVKIAVYQNSGISVNTIPASSVYHCGNYGWLARIA